LVHLVDTHTLGGVPLVAALTPRKDGREGVHQVEDCPGQDHDVVGVEPEGHHCCSIAHTWGEVGKIISSVILPPTDYPDVYIIVQFGKP